MNQPSAKSENAPGILVMIDYPSSIGFAIGRLVKSFFEAALGVVGTASRVSFAFSELKGSPQWLAVADDSMVRYSSRCRTVDDDRALAAFVRRRNIQLVFALDLPVEAPVSRVLRQAGVRAIVSYWGAPMSSENNGIRLLFKRWEVRARRHSPDLYVFESRAMQQLAVRGRGIPERRTCIIPTGVDPAVFESAPRVRSVLSELGIPEAATVVVFMGHMHERKGVGVLLEAARIIYRDYARTDIHFLFLGNTPEEATKYTATLLEGQSTVTLAGYRSDVPSLLAACDIGCIPSSGWDSFPMSALEMQAAGLPMVVSDLQGVPETILPGRTGTVVAAGDAEALARALVRLADDPGGRQEFARAARAHIRAHLTRERQVEALSQMFKDIGRSRGVQL